MCQKCGKPNCCCQKTISKTGKQGKRGPRGPAGPPGVFSIESGTFTLAANGLSCTGGTIGGTGSAPTITIVTTKQLRLAHFNSLNTDNLEIGSFGKDNLAKNDCMYFNDTPASAGTDLYSVFVVSQAGNGFSGKITSINPTTYVITFNKIGAGLNVTGNWHAITS